MVQIEKHVPWRDQGNGIPLKRSLEDGAAWRAPVTVPVVCFIANSRLIGTADNELAGDHRDPDKNHGQNDDKCAGSG